MTRLGGLAIACGIAMTSAAATVGAVQTDAVASSSNDYQAFCAACHGKAGVGDGSIAHSLRKPPANLTLLARNNGGEFPAAAVTKVIAGGHRGTDMPAWAEIFAKSKDSPDPEAVKARIESLVRYLEELQAKP